MPGDYDNQSRSMLQPINCFPASAARKQVWS